MQRKYPDIVQWEQETAGPRANFIHRTSAETDRLTGKPFILHQISYRETAGNLSYAVSYGYREWLTV